MCSHKCYNNIFQIFQLFQSYVAACCSMLQVISVLFEGFILFGRGRVGVGRRGRAARAGGGGGLADGSAGARRTGVPFP